MIRNCGFLLEKIQENWLKKFHCFCCCKYVITFAYCQFCHLLTQPDSVWGYRMLITFRSSHLFIEFWTILRIWFVNFVEFDRNHYIFTAKSHLSLFRSIFRIMGKLSVDLTLILMDSLGSIEMDLKRFLSEGNFADALADPGFRKLLINGISSR